ncbi:hypothetical protein V2J09_010420 [Rumex salicifolius]
MTLKTLDSNTSPLSITEPFKLSFEILSAKASIIVDLPDPLAPRTARISPTLASPQMSSAKVDETWI